MFIGCVTNVSPDVPSECIDNVTLTGEPCDLLMTPAVPSECINNVMLTEEPCDLLMKARRARRCAVFNRRPDEVYCERECRDLHFHPGFQVLVSPCGTGKTKSLHRYLLGLADQCDDLCVINATHRHATSDKAFATLPKLNNR
jgi:hypothetical protein